MTPDQTTTDEDHESGRKRPRQRRAANGHTRGAAVTRDRSANGHQRPAGSKDRPRRRAAEEQEDAVADKRDRDRRTRGDEDPTDEEQGSAEDRERDAAEHQVEDDPADQDQDDEDRAEEDRSEEDQAEEAQVDENQSDEDRAEDDQADEADDDGADQDQQDEPVEDEDDQAPGAEEPDEEQDSGDRPKKRRTASWAIRAVRSQFTDLSRQEIERITGVAKDDDSTWTVGVEVVEIRMVPDTADILAQYDVQVDEDGDIVGYRRTRRHLRGRADD
jgi:hypothetical protein